jgi:hypothetical protein
VLSRLLSPAGFVLVFLLFLLPFVGISCSAPDVGSLDADVSGFGLVTNADPTFETDSPVADMVAVDSAEMPTTDVSLPATLVLVLLAAGAGCAVLARPRTRLLAAGGLAILAAALLVVTQLLAESNLATNAIENAQVIQQTVPQDLSPVTNEGFVADAVNSRIGFWSSLVALVLVAALNLLALARSSGREPAP